MKVLFILLLVIVWIKVFIEAKYVYDTFREPHITDAAKLLRSILLLSFVISVIAIGGFTYFTILWVIT